MIFWENMIWSLTFNLSLMDWFVFLKIFLRVYHVWHPFLMGSHHQPIVSLLSLIMPFLCYYGYTGLHDKVHGHPGHYYTLDPTLCPIWICKTMYRPTYSFYKLLIYTLPPSQIINRDYMFNIIELMWYPGCMFE